MALEKVKIGQNEYDLAKGTVTSVNDETPDSNGNVQLDATKINVDDTASTKSSISNAINSIGNVANNAKYIADNSVQLTGNQTIAGNKTFNNTVYLNGGASSVNTISQVKSDYTKQVNLRNGFAEVVTGTSTTTYDENKIVRLAQLGPAEYVTTFNLPNKVDGNTYTLATTSENTYQTTPPTSAISDGGIHIVYLTSEPTTKYSGYIYLIAES